MSTSVSAATKQENTERREYTKPSLVKPLHAKSMPWHTSYHAHAFALTIPWLHESLRLPCVTKASAPPFLNTNSGQFSRQIETQVVASLCSFRHGDHVIKETRATSHVMLRSCDVTEGTPLLPPDGERILGPSAPPYDGDGACAIEMRPLHPTEQPPSYDDAVFREPKEQP